jgi:hypothetical protein
MTYGLRSRGNKANTAMTLNRFLTCGVVVFRFVNQKYQKGGGDKVSSFAGFVQGFAKLQRFSQPGLINRVGGFFLISPTHKRTEGRAPVWGSQFTSKDAALHGGSTRNRCYAELEIVRSAQ